MRTRTAGWLTAHNHPRQVARRLTTQPLRPVSQAARSITSSKVEKLLGRLIVFTEDSPSFSDRCALTPYSRVNNKRQNAELATISFEELERLASNLDQYWYVSLLRNGAPSPFARHKETRTAKCPCCDRKVTAKTPNELLQHLATHLADRRLYMFHCPYPNCLYAAMRIACIKNHVPTHGIPWTDQMVRSQHNVTNLSRVQEALSVNVENRARFYALYQSL